MEMQACCLVAQLVGQMHSDLFPNVGCDCWKWPLIVEAYDRSCVQTIRVPVDPSNVPVIHSSRYAHDLRQGSEKKEFWEHHGSKSEVPSVERL